jgi:hypothetical protein
LAEQHLKRHADGRRGERGERADPPQRREVTGPRPEDRADDDRATKSGGDRQQREGA